MIAEDEPLFRKILSQLLSPEFDLTVTEDGTTALAGRICLGGKGGDAY
jgi:CheY-like chemotaxis protein